MTKGEALPGTPRRKSSNVSTPSSKKAPKVDGSEFQPQVTARYPLADHEENPLLTESVTLHASGHDVVLAIIFFAAPAE